MKETMYSTLSNIRRKLAIIAQKLLLYVHGMNMKYSILHTRNLEIMKMQRNKKKIGNYKRVSAKVSLASTYVCSNTRGPKHLIVGLSRNNINNENNSTRYYFNFTCDIFRFNTVN